MSSMSLTLPGLVVVCLLLTLVHLDSFLAGKDKNSKSPTDSMILQIRVEIQTARAAGEWNHSQRVIGSSKSHQTVYVSLLRQTRTHSRLSSCSGSSCLLIHTVSLMLLFRTSQ